MPVYKESGYQFDLPDGKTFRFAECPTYQTHLSAHELKEMDFGWIVDDSAPVVWLAEVSNYSLGPDAQEVSLPKFLEEAVHKITDCLLMLSAVWAETATGRELRRDIEQTCPEFPNQAADVRAAILVGFESEDSAFKMETISNSLRPRLRGRMRCMGTSLPGGAATLIFSLSRSSTTLPVSVNLVQ